MRSPQVAILAAAILAGCSSTDTATTAQADAHGCATGESYCRGCNGSSYCSRGEVCPGLACAAEPIDSGAADDASSSDAMSVPDGDAESEGNNIVQCGATACSIGQVCVTRSGGPQMPEDAAPFTPVGECKDWPASCAGPRDCNCQELCGSQPGTGVMCIKNGDGAYTCGYP